MSKLISTFFYIGYLRPAPGTWGSLTALIISFALFIENGGKRSCKFSSLLDSSSPMMSGLVAKNCPSFIKVVPIDSKEIDNLSPSSLVKSFFYFFENENDKI